MDIETPESGIKADLHSFLQFSSVSSIILREINIEAGLYSVKS